MPEPTTNNPPDYSTKTKAELLEVLAAQHEEAVRGRAAIATLRKDLEATRAELVSFQEAAQHEEQIARAREEEAAAKRASRGPAKLLGRIDIFDTDDPEDVLQRATAVRAGKIPASVAKIFKTDARLRAPKGSGLAKRLGARSDEIAVEVPLGTEFRRGEVPDASIDAWCEAGAVQAIG